MVLQVCAYGADYAGNFIASLEILEQQLNIRGVKTIYAFVEKAKDKEWCKKIQQRTKVYFLPEKRARILPATYAIFKKIYKENSIDIMHSHFELYDIPASLMAPKNVKLFWHLHDPIVETGRVSRQILDRFQYGLVGRRRRAELISVSGFYRNLVVRIGFPYDKTVVVLNGIDLGRIRKTELDNRKKYDFLTFGWDFYRKGDDLILEACKHLNDEGYKFCLLLNGNENTWRHLKEFYKDNVPEYLTLGNPVEDVNQLFDEAKVFIQASRRETFSYAVCEAAYAGLPVISSDIVGLEWAKEIPLVKFFESESTVQLFELMRNTLNNSKLYTEDDIENSRNIIKENYSTTSWANKILKIYQID